MASRSALDIEGLGDKAARALLESGVLADEGDLFLIDEEDLRRSAFFTRDAGRGESGAQLTENAKTVLAELAVARTRPLWRVMVALSMRHVGPPTAKEPVNQRREFFFATPQQVREILGQAVGSLLEFTDKPEATEYYESKGSWPDHAGH